MTACWVYVRSEPGLWTVGHYAPDGLWVAESDHASTDQAAARVHWLNGGGPPRMSPCPHCDQAAVTDEQGCCIHCGADRTPEVDGPPPRWRPDPEGHRDLGGDHG